MIEFQNVSKSYKKGSKAVDGLNMTVNNGDRMVPVKVRLYGC